MKYKPCRECRWKSMRHSRHTTASKQTSAMPGAATKRDSWKTSSTSPSCHYPSIPTTQMHGSPPHILPDDRSRLAREPHADGQPRHRQDALDDGIQHKRACLLATRNAAPLTSEIERWILPSVEPAATSEYVLMAQWFMITWLTFSLTFTLPTRAQPVVDGWAHG